MSGYFDREAEDESEDESMDEMTGEIKKKKKAVSGKKSKKSRDNDINMDSSEEENTEDEEEGLAKVRENFIVDDDEEEEEEEESPSESDGRSGKKRKRRRSAREEPDDDEMDEDDLELIAENTGQDRSRGNKLKRFKRGRVDERASNEDRALSEIFSEDEADDLEDLEDLEDDTGRRRRDDGRGFAPVDEFEGFIEDDDFSEDGEEERPRKPNRRDHKGGTQMSTAGDGALNIEAMEKMEEIFGDGYEYEWALTTAEDIEDENRDQVMALEDVFEPSELKERMLTDEDNEIRSTDIPERFQLARKPYAHVKITDEEYAEEGNWIATMMFGTKRNLLPHHREPFFRAVNRVLDFIVKDNMEIPFIYQNRKDYIIHNEARGGDRLLSQDELWNVFELELKYRALIDKKNAVKRTYQSLGIHDEIYTSRIGDMENIEEIQDLQEYLQFQYSEEIKDLSAMQSNGANGVHKKRPGATRTIFDKIRKSRVYSLVKAFGISAAEFALNVSLDQKRKFPDEPAEFPNEMADACVDGRDFKTGSEVLKAAKMMLAEEFFMNPVLRRVVRQKLFINGQLDVKTTDKGLKKIDELHPYYEFKYLKNQSTMALLANPSRFLKMLAAENEGLVTLQIEMATKTRFLRQLYDLISSENYSDQADAWNEERKDVVDIAMEKLLHLMAKNYKENLKTVCEDELAKQVRKNYLERLDQAPYLAKGLKLGEIPRVLALSAGQANDLRDGILALFMDEEGKVLETLKLVGLRDSEEVKKLVELINRRKPDVVAIGGFTVATHNLYESLRKVIEEESLLVAGMDDDHNERALLDIWYIQDEVARLYMGSERAVADFPSLSQLGRYCAALARYMQNPLLEYAALGEDVYSINFHPDQQLLPPEKLKANLESAMVDMVNLCGVDINDVVKSQYVANLLPYLCGLGPRKAGHILKMIGQNGGQVQSRSSMVGDPDKNIKPLMGPCVWTNCASFAIIQYEASESESEYLDSTRVHPQDYELGRKMAADALELDEEDVAVITNHGDDPGAVVRQLIEQDDQDKVNELILEEYADELEKNFNQRKRATLETIRAELQVPFEELRNPFRRLQAEEIFTKLTGETAESLGPGMIVPVNIRRITDRFLITKLDCGVSGNVASEEMSDKFGVSPHSLFHVSQTVQAKIKTLNIRSFYAELTLKESELRIPFRRTYDREPGEWDEDQEEKDRVALTVKQEEQHRAARVIKHPLFRAFNSRQAEEYLAQHSRGDVVIRPSSKGQDHIAITWKVGDGLYQHIDVLELEKENEFSIGRTLKVGGKYTYSDLDDLIFNHIKPMAKKVGEIERHDKFKNCTREQAEQWLTTYAEAFPGRTVYIFCPDPKRPGHFDLCFKTGLNKPCHSWKVTVVPQAFSLANNLYGDVNALCNGFKILFTNQQQQYQGRMEQQMRQQRYGGPPPPMRR
ncbi:Transcription elongation factor spt6 [Orbilia brochopaga]|uniref:Transcription elongation factor Spt6 n=1 Tax=Orbilia brochopaga TaxID=3140254 RepID=A0AAV9U6S4_9PEZI